MRTALKLVESPTFYREEIQLWDSDSDRNSHSLHYALPYPYSFQPELASYFITKYSRRGQVVLDPFCGGGTVPLEAGLLGRIAIATDASPWAVRISRAKLCPADISEVTLWLQQANLSRPVSLEEYRKAFSTFFDPDTFREICNLRSLLEQRSDKVSRFVEFITSSILHGHSAGYLSAYTFPQVSLSPAEQQRINAKRHQAPDYRAVVPRILRKAALVLRDGIPSVLRQMEPRCHFSVGDARALSSVQSSSVDLVVTGPPIPGMRPVVPDLWMRFWFSRLSPESSQVELVTEAIQEWREFVNEFLFEMARIVRNGGRLVMDLREVKLASQVFMLDDVVVDLVQEGLARYWEPECVLVQPVRSTKLRNQLKERDEARLRNSNRLVVLRRR